MQELYAKVTAMQTEYYGLRSEIAATDRQIDGLNTHLSMWKQYASNKPFRQRLAALKPRVQAAYQDERYTELAQYDAAVRYLNGLKASGEKIIPKHWQPEMERLSAHNGTLYQRMKAMRTEIQAVEKIRKDRRRACPVGGGMTNRHPLASIMVAHSPNKSLCEPVRDNVKTRTSFSIRYTSNQSL